MPRLALQLVALVVWGGKGGGGGRGAFLPLGLWTRAQPMMMRNIRAEKITTSMVPTYMRSLTGGFELGKDSGDACADEGDEVSFITRFKADIFGGLPLSLATRVRLYSGTLWRERGAPFTWTVSEIEAETSLKWPSSLPLSMATLVSPLGPVSSSLTTTIATTLLFGDRSSKLTKRFAD